MARPIHYAPYAMTMMFDCLKSEWDQHTDSAYLGEPEVTGHRFTAHSIGQPLTRSDLLKVTCPDCWASILRMAIRKARHDNTTKQEGPRP